MELKEAECTLNGLVENEVAEFDSVLLLCNLYLPLVDQGGNFTFPKEKHRNDL